MADDLKWELSDFSEFRKEEIRRYNKIIFD